MASEISSKRSYFIFLLYDYYFVWQSPAKPDPTNWNKRIYKNQKRLAKLTLVDSKNISINKC